MSNQSRLLWNKFVRIAQPYFYPTVKGGGWVTLLLMLLLLVFLFALLFVIVAAITLTGHQLNPALTTKIAPGLTELIQGMLSSPLVYVLLATLLIPIASFVAFGRHLRSRWQQWALLATVLLLSISVTGINVWFSFVGNFFNNALVKKNQDLSYLFVAVYFVGFLIGIPIVAFYGYVQDYLGLRWRKWLTNDFLGKYFQNRAYYEIDQNAEIDNPDQRISQDINNFTGTTLSFLLIILGSVMDLVSFSGILWAKSQLLVGVVIGYSVLGSALAILIGRRLVRLNFNQLKYEADFRYSLVHVRDNVEAIAFYRGEGQEAQQIGNRFINVLRNYNLLIGWQRNLSFFTTAYRYIPVVLPYLVLFPQYFSGKIEFGDMTQANFAFSQVYAALSLIVSQIQGITGFAAGIDRLAIFTDNLTPETTTTSEITVQQDSKLALDDVTVLVPRSGRKLVDHLSLSLEQGKSLVIVGASGAGKSSLLRAIAGIWQSGAGTIQRPALEDMMFLPQRPYMILGSLRSQLLYPNTHHQVSDEELQKLLERVNLGDLPARLGGFDIELDWADVLSLGEQQRLAFARLLLAQPRYAVLDEATSALDINNEKHLYQQIQELGMTYVSVGHRPSVLQYHQQVLELEGEAHWQLMPVKDYAARQSAA